MYLTPRRPGIYIRTIISKHAYYFTGGNYNITTTNKNYLGYAPLRRVADILRARSSMPLFDREYWEKYTAAKKAIKHLVNWSGKTGIGLITV